MQLFISNFDTCSIMAAAEIGKLLKEKPDAVLGFATGSTPLQLYQNLVKACKDNLIDFSKAKAFNLDEYANIPKDHPCSYYYYMKENLYKHINIREENYQLPDGMAKNLDEECVRYEDSICRAGGIDLQVLGIGHNGHIGFNEPGTPFESRTHLTNLDPLTVKANSRFFNSPDEVPKQALTMGIKTIMRARRLILLVKGADKAEILCKSLLGPVTTEVPASILQLHPNLMVFADEEAGSCLTSSQSCCNTANL
jgi:glucosamine-6-phosphate deaminase